MVFNKNIIVLLILIIIPIVGCDSDFLTNEPTEFEDRKKIVKTTDGLLALINGIHRFLYTEDERATGGGIGGLMIQNDCLGEDFVMTNKANRWFVDVYKWEDHRKPSDGDNLFPYRMYYKIIRNANTVIVNAKQAKGSDKDKKIVLGQAYLYRAWSYFQLVQLYGKRYAKAGDNSNLGVPLRLTTSKGPLARSTVAEVYIQLNKDIDKAITLLQGYVRVNKSNLDNSVGMGLKARVALVQGNYKIAADYAKKVRELGVYQLMSTTEYFNNFSDYKSREWMWGSHLKEDQSALFSNFGAYISRNFSSTNIKKNPKAINSKLYKTIPKTDVRSKIFDPTGKHLNLPKDKKLTPDHKEYPYTSQKFLSISDKDSRMDVPYMRISEMYLIEAEANARLGNYKIAAEVLFKMAKVRDTAYHRPSTKTGQELIDEILLQRRWELWGEGFRFYDLKRLNKPLDRTGVNHFMTPTLHIPAGDKRWQWLFPREAIEGNKLLEQNEI